MRNENDTNNNEIAMIWYGRIKFTNTGPEWMSILHYIYI